MTRPGLTPSEIVAILVVTPDELATLTTGVTNEQLNTEPQPAGWSVSYILANLRAAEVVLGGQMMRIVAEDHPAWKRLSPREYIRRTDFPEWQFSAALDAFRAHRAQILDVLRPLPEDAWLRTALVTDAPGQGRRSHPPLLRRLAGFSRARAHRSDPRNLRQIQQLRATSDASDPSVSR